MPYLQLKRDANNNPVPIMPAVIALAKTYDTTISTSTQVTFNADTTLIEVSAISQPIFMKWGTTAVTSANWDYIIQAGNTRQFFLPVLTQPSTLYTAATFLEQAASATLAVSEY
tara:strand:+ start:1077 stop:1418 length:342 start_codon:yes stop_codon:yes gene_type:complete